MEQASENWTVGLSGDDWSLEGLCRSFTQEQCKVQRGEDGDYYLTSPELTACGTDNEAWEVASRLVSHINSAAKMSERGYDPVHAGALIRTEPNGTRSSSVRASGQAVGRARLRAFGVEMRDGKVVEPSGPSFAERLLYLQEREPPGSAVRRVLEQWGQREQTPTSLGDILENIRDDLWGRPANNKAEAWKAMGRRLAPPMGMSEHQLDAELRRCRKSLNNPAAVGSEARHADPRFDANPMSLDKARGFVHRLLRAWLDGKI